VTVTPADLGTYLGVTVDDARATLILGHAAELCLSMVNPLPAGADSVILDVAARAYGNPTNVTQESVGPYSANFGPVGGGLWLTRQNKATLRRLAGAGGGAFTIETMPAGAGLGLPWWDVNVVLDDFDVPL
jgi:hypothetical protein